MNRYGKMAYDHASRHRPKSFSAMADPIGHFTRLGEQVESEIVSLRDRLLGPIRPDENLEDYRHRGYRARRQAEEMVLAELVWTEAEPTTLPEDDEVLAHRSQLALISRTLAAADRAWVQEPTEPVTPP